MKEQLKTVTVKLPQDYYDVLKKLADADFRSVPSYIRLVLREHIGNQ